MFSVLPSVDLSSLQVLFFLYLFLVFQLSLSFSCCQSEKCVCWEVSFICHFLSAKATWFWHWHRRNRDIARDLVREISTNVSDDFLGWSCRSPEKRPAKFREQCGWGWFTRASRTFFLRRHCAFRSYFFLREKTILCNHKKNVVFFFLTGRFSQLRTFWSCFSFYR